MRALTVADHLEWDRMRTALWPDHTEAELESWAARPDAVTFVAVRSESRLYGFLEAGTRRMPKGACRRRWRMSKGWYVDPDVRCTGIGAALMVAVEAWAGASGFRELASDAGIANVGSQRAHRHLGFEEVDRAGHYRKSL